MIGLFIRALNEEDRVEQCIRYHKPYVDYVYVLDGGSTDKTVQLAEPLADKVVVDPDRHWGRFTTRHSEAIPHRWVLMVDVDEYMDVDFLRRMRGIICRHSTISYRLPRVNLPSARDYPDYHVRLWRNDVGILWMNKIHEAPTLRGELLDSLNADHCLTLHKYPITHLPRRVDILRPWWNPDGTYKHLDELKNSYEFT